MEDIEVKLTSSFDFKPKPLPYLMVEVAPGILDLKPRVVTLIADFISIEEVRCLPSILQEAV